MLSYFTPPAIAEAKVTKKTFTKGIVLSTYCALYSIALMMSSHSYAHFLELIPDRDDVSNTQPQALNFSLRFTHPMSQGPIMNMALPKQLFVSSNNKTTDLLPTLKTNAMQNQQWSFTYRVTEPGDLKFFVEPTPYWEADEGKMIIHYTKVVVDGFGDFNGWDQSIGAPLEIEPLSRPYSLWVGNNFSGIVKHQGKPVAYAQIEVEWRNDGSVLKPTDSYITQVIKADANGTFHYALPRAGWWGFAALIDATYQLPSPTGKQVPVELGGLIWINAKQMQ